ncbi:MAG TPA: BamA/TamA family outer membrane protein, partial [Fibrobacteria bacterium]|nr:BamA/TamA family outer membrane protein [Fibrobacteria bacterium]
WSGFFKLGKERYEITSQEERQRGGMNMRKVLKEIDIKRLRDQMLTRKVVALHLYAARAYESSDERMPVYGLVTLGNNTPMRGYSGSRFRDYAVASAGMEYRFPVVRLMDGVIFNEYGVFGRTFPDFDWSDRLRNSWGLGIRVRRPDIFLFRTDFGFHGLHGIVVNLSVDAAY